MGPEPKVKTHAGLRNIHMRYDALHGYSSRRLSSTKTLTPGGMRRLNEKARSKTIRVLNVEPIAEEPEDDVSVPIDGSHASHLFDMPLPDFGRAEDWVDDDDASHDEARQVYEDLLQGIRKMRRVDERTRRDALERSYQYWAPQFDEMAEAYKAWEFNESIGYEMPSTLDGCYSLEVKVIDIFGTSLRSVPLPGDTNQSSSMVRAGLFPTSPITHRSGIATRTLQLFHNLFTRCPRLSIQPFVKALCDLQGVPFKPYMMIQLRQAYDAYLEVQRRVRKQTMEALGRGSPDWRITHACVPCQFRLEEDKELEIRMMAACDGNDSLKRDEAVDEGVDEMDADRLKERKDPREGGGDYFLSEAEVDRWEEDKWGEIPSLAEEPTAEDRNKLKEWVWAEGKCEDKWHNAKDANTTRAWAKFRETGLFLLLCRHGHVLQMCDMIRSGEKAKYPLAILHAFMSAEKRQREANGEGRPSGGLCIAYDIVCTHSKTIARSPLSELAKWSRYIAGIMMMHGYGHERACQLAFLLLYIAGAGLEDLETCEQYFSKLNALPTATRHASIFHRRQAIAEYAHHTDVFETYGNLSKFIFNNYKQALKILATQEVLVAQMKKAELTGPSVFLDWLKEEAEYLQNLSIEPQKETLEMEYYRKLSGLYETTAILKEARSSWLLYVRPEPRDKEVDKTLVLERAAHHARENQRKLTEEVQGLENKLEIRIRWTEGGDEWKVAEELVAGAVYRRALDKLEGLLVKRMFEMGRLNVAGTGYKLRKHLAKALKTRSQSIRKAIDQYNDAAKKMDPPRATVNWNEAVDYSFLSEFDILRDTRDDVRMKVWATPGNRVLLNQFFKIVGAGDELDRLHQEIQRLVTFMKVEREELMEKEQDLQQSDPGLALQIQRFRLERGRFNNQHRKRLLSIFKLKGFTWENEKYFCPGTPVERWRAQVDTLGEGNLAAERMEQEEEDEDDDEDDEEVWIEEEEEELLEADTLLDLAVDQTV